MCNTIYPLFFEGVGVPAKVSSSNSKVLVKLSYKKAHILYNVVAILIKFKFINLIFRGKNVFFRIMNVAFHIKF